jgi:hypothetical protein
VPVCIDSQRSAARNQAAPIAAMEKAGIADLALDILAVCEHLWQVIGNRGIVRNRTLIVPGTKALHHVPPDLVPPMDRAWTGSCARAM